MADRTFVLKDRVFIVKDVMGKIGNKWQVEPMVFLYTSVY